MKTRLMIVLLAFCVARGMMAQITSLGLAEECDLSSVDLKGAMEFVPELSFVDNSLYVATPKGLYRYLCDGSRDSAEWEKLPLTDQLVLTFVVRDDTLIVLTRDELLVSLDGGVTAKSLPVEEATDSGKKPLRGMAVHPHDANRIFVSSALKLMYTHDGGTTWEEICYDDGSRILLTRLFYNPHNVNQLVGYYNVAQWASHLRYSHNGGLRWSPVDIATGGELWDKGYSETYNIAFHPILENRIILCGSNSYGISEDGGASWTGIFNTELDQLAAYLTDIVYDKRNSDILYGLDTKYTQSGITVILRSTDGGYTWEEIFYETIAPKGHAISFDMRDNLLALYTGNGIYLLDVDAIDTSVSPIVNDGSESVYYDLTGRKVSHPTRGIYIKDGRKVVMF